MCHVVYTQHSEMWHIQFAQCIETLMLKPAPWRLGLLCSPSCPTID